MQSAAARANALRTDGSSGALCHRPWSLDVEPSGAAVLPSRDFSGRGSLPRSGLWSVSSAGILVLTCRALDTVASHRLKAVMVRDRGGYEANRH
jgi:hypothetical protein